MDYMKYKIKNTVEVNGTLYEIRSEYSVILTIFEALQDSGLSEAERFYIVLYMFYPEFEKMNPADYEEAVKKCFLYIDGGEELEKKKGPKVIDWEQDFPFIVSAVNRVLGYDIRTIPYDFENNTGGVSWETFISAYYEIGDCLFAQIVRIRDAQARGKKLDKSDQEWLRNNRHLVTMKTHYTEAEDEIMKLFT